MRFYTKLITLILTFLPLFVLSAETKEIPKTTYITKSTVLETVTEPQEIHLAFLDKLFKNIKIFGTQSKKEPVDQNLENEFLETSKTTKQNTSKRVPANAPVITDQSLEEEFENSQPIAKKEVPEMTKTTNPAQATLPSLEDLSEKTGKPETQAAEEAVLEIPEESEDVALPSLEDLPEETGNFEAQAIGEENLLDTAKESEEITRPSLEDYARGTEQLKSQLIEQLENKNKVGSKDQGLQKYLETKTVNRKKKYDFQDIELHVVGQHEDTLSREQIKRDVSSSNKAPKTTQK